MFPMIRTLLIALLLCPVAARAQTVKLAADEWCPYNCAPGSDRPGYLIEIAREALKAGGFTVDYVTMPWNRALFEMKAGSLAGAVGASPTEATGLFPKEPMAYGRNVLALTPDKAGAFRWTGPESLSGLKLGGAQGYSYDQGGPIDAYIAKAGKAVELLSGTEVQSQNLRKLLAGRLDAVIEDENVLRLAIAEMQPRPDVRLIPVSAASVVSIGFSPAIPASATYIKLIDDFLVAARKDGRLKAILARYGVEDLAP
jgi:polar amino acid transport system substrate-binding protein